MPDFSLIRILLFIGQAAKRAFAALTFTATAAHTTGARAVDESIINYIANFINNKGSPTYAFVLPILKLNSN
jgi:hypothetical protein